MRARLIDYEEKFRALVDSRGDSDCWPYLGPRDKDGYGRFYAGQYRTTHAHRYAWELFHGRQARLLICHTCDNPPCCNPSHLFEGTNADNMRDMVKKGRQSKHTGERKRRVGSANGRCRFTPEQLAVIRDLVTEGISDCEIGRRFGVTSTAIRYIRIGRNHSADLVAADIQRQEVRRRSLSRCEFEVIFDTVPHLQGKTGYHIVLYNGFRVKAQRDEKGRIWARCNRPAGQTAHVYRRWKCTPGTKFDARVALDGCDRCHKRYDAYFKDVRVAPELLRAAWDLIIYDAEGEGFQARCVVMGALGPRP